jgi:hypothetical protein
MFSYSLYYSKTERKSTTLQHINQNSPYQLLYCVSIIVPLRYLCYPNELFWTEEGFRFSWRVMLMEKAGYATFKVKMLLLKRNHNQQQSLLTTFQKTNGSSLISFCNMPLFT